ncbi:hypothetical protein PHYBLDRAFT_111766, partial [Phycomyces blakesleeanus NRRL 1555(-)]
MSNWICQQKIEKRTASNVKRYIDHILYPVKFGVVGDISLSSINKYMKTWGFSFRKFTSTVYVDGHKREDVVKYREEWSQQMMTYKKRMEEYSGDNMEVVEEPKVLHGEKKLVLVTHDKSTFYAYDRREKNWLDNKENPLPKKGQGQSIMVSEF